jgi:hypothetical protein
MRVTLIMLCLRVLNALTWLAPSEPRTHEALTEVAEVPHADSLQPRRCCFVIKFPRVSTFAQN